MPAVYEEIDVRFLYPENWTLADEEKEDWPRAVSVQSPSTGFWALHVYPSPQNPDLLAEEALQGLRDAYEDIEAEQACEKIGPVDAVGYDLDFIYLDFVVRAEIRCFTVGGRTFVILCQAESREFDELADVFRAITVSLLQP